LIKYFLIYLDIIAPLLVLPFILYNWKKLYTEQYILLISIFILTQLLSNCASETLYFFKINNHIIFHLNAIFSFAIISTIFRKFYTSSSLYKIIIILYTIIYLSYLLFSNHIFAFNSYGFALGAFYIVYCCLKYYLNLLRKPQIQYIYQDPFFWFVTGLFTYYSCNFIIFLTYDILTQKGFKVGYLWRIHNIFTLVMMLYFIKGYIIQINYESRNNYYS
jgi:hypothetical protein